VFYQTNGTQDPNTSTTDQWNVMFAQSLNAAAREPVFTISQASDHVNHVGPICNLGLLCASGTRNLLDFFQVAIGPDGLANVVYAEDTTGPRHPEFARQASGPLALTNPVVRTCLPLRSEEHTSELQSRGHLVCRLLLEKKNCSDTPVPPLVAASHSRV